MVKSKGGKIILVVMESLAGTGHKAAMLRPRQSTKRQSLMYDPFVNQKVLYKEIKKIKTKTK